MRKTYETERLVLKTPDPAFAERVLDYYRRNRTFLEEWEPVRDEKFYTLRFQRGQLENDRRELRNGTSFRLWIFKKQDPARAIGTLGFGNIVRGAFLSCFLGYKLDRDEINNGYMTEALRAGSGVMFGEYGLHRIEANIMPKNGRSLRVAEKLGFCSEGLARRYLNINGRWEDHIHMVLLNDTCGETTG